MSISSTEEKLQLYFQGELDSIIFRLYKKINMHYSDDYYLTIRSVDTTKPYAGNTNSRADPTGNRAANLIDLRESTKELYMNYKSLKTIIQNNIKQLSDEEITILKTHLGLTEDSITSLRKKIGFTHFAIKRKIKALLEMFDNKITGGMTFGSEENLEKHQNFKAEKEAL